MGLKAYSPCDAPLFFGRERVIVDLMDWIVDESDPRFVAVVGASGTGKSSVIKAGLLPRLLAPTDEILQRGGRWTIVHAARLGRKPIEQLDAALKQLDSSPAGHRKLLFVDQFEELYTRCHDDAVRDDFLDRLSRLVDDNKDMTVLVTLRSDFEPRAASSQVIGDLWAKGRFLVPALNFEEFRDCIIGPAQVKAIYFEPDALVNDILGEVMAMPGGLPMLSFALSEMYQCAQARRRETGGVDRALTKKDYESTGGVVGALHRRASKLYDDSDPHVQATIRRVFLRMLAQDGARITRRRIHLAELEFADKIEQERVKQVIDMYVNARLLVVDGNEIEPAHDTLVVAWEKLLDWLSRGGPQVVIRATWRTARDWLQSNRDKGMLWNDNPRLPLA
ncbi:MAG: ATP-binding protein, partial [Gammaproteobacteria bacterium]|nr:ATP-binding protein [Gammaproteobacteria bacterium]